MRPIILTIWAAALAVSPAAAGPPPPLLAEKSDVAKLAPMADHWVLVQTQPSGVTLFDADHGRILAGLPVADFSGNTAMSPDRKRIYVAERCGRGRPAARARTFSAPTTPKR